VIPALPSRRRGWTRWLVAAAVALAAAAAIVWAIG